ncbi:sialate O-acetylesterase [Maribellus maritimus]|uniref:sialate O-acetylesterase n=1 Tax=Maribellus maritimus TaxID=2870838 RepID=UPI001EECF359|nr:sialate O-acetylesterase [Maribellus maritimus]MCG6188260.1 sialate O-acetylesterase [Maribellus maritimus]
MKIKILLLFTLLFLNISGKSQEKPFDLYLLIGQSNMAGRGTVEARDTIIPERVFTLDKNNKWVPAQDPIHFDKSVAGVGLGRTFGIEMAKANQEKIIGLIPCAVGGSSIEAWTPGGFHDQTNSYPWDDMEKRLKIALQKGKLKGILWHQGESDSNPEKCKTYSEKLEVLISEVRKLAGDETIPFVAGELGRFKIKENSKKFAKEGISPAKTVVKETKTLMKKDNNAAFVSSRGLHHRGDNTHFDSKSYRTFGKRYAVKMTQLQKK